MQGYDIKGRKWSQLPGLSSPRHGVAVAVVKDALYSIGGASEAGHVGSTRKSEVLDLSGKEGAPATANVKWRVGTAYPAKVQYAAATDVGGRPWLFGGIGDNETPTATPPPSTVRSTTGRRTAAPAAGPPRRRRQLRQRGRGHRRLPARRRADVRRVQPRLRAARRQVGAAPAAQPCARGGCRSGRRRQDRGRRRPGRRRARARDRGLRRLEWTDVAEIPTPREHLGAASDGRYLYAVGGRELSAAKNTASFERYDPAADSWTGSTRCRRRSEPWASPSWPAASSPSAARAARPSRMRCRPTTWQEGLVAAPAPAQAASRLRGRRAQRLALRHRRRCGRRARPVDAGRIRARPRLTIRSPSRARGRGRTPR